MRSLPSTLDIITSGLNEEKCIPELYRRIVNEMQQFPEVKWQLIVCDNGSSDNSWAIICDLAKKDARVFGIRLSRTYSFDSGLTCGLDHASAEAVILMASDLQDPPEVFSKFFQKYCEGFDQVAVKVIKKDQVPYLRRLLSGLFYKIANRFTENMIPRNVSDFRMVSRIAYVGIRSLRESNRFLRGIMAWSGYRTAFVEMERPARHAGKSAFLQIKLFKVIQWATNAIFAYSAYPLQLIAVTGVFFGLISIIATIVSSIMWLVIGVPFAGFGTLVSLITLGFSILLLSMGIISQYLALVYEEVKMRPLYLISETTKV
jgi:glycosyltransferase involved in cell wall biosynthesis